MRAEALRVQLRPRSGWEAADLGFMMAREWWRPLWGTWLAAYLPLALALTWAFRAEPMYAALILWWLKPAFDRVALHVLSRAVFGETTTVKSTLRDRNLLRPGLFHALTLGRLSLARSFLLPVAQLEHLTGRDARQRRSALSRRERGFAVGLTVACAHFEFIVMIGLGLLVSMLTPAAGAIAPDLAAWFAGSGDDRTFWSVYDGLAYVAAVCFVEPLYVAGGFAVYLNRRTLLEGWDIEVALRRLADRLAVNARRAAVVLLAASVAFTAAMPGDAIAADVEPSIATALLDEETAPRADAATPAEAAARAKSAPQSAIREVLRSPDFAQYRDDMQWQSREKPDPRKPRPDMSGFSNLLRMIAEIVQSLGWVIVAILACVALYAAWRYAQRYAERSDVDGYRPPETLFGLSVAPETLPDDVAAAALAAARAGRLREALSLLYRGALSALVHRHEVRLEPGDTEGDCVRLAAKAIDRGAAGYFAGLVGAWQNAAYAGRDPDLARVEALADEWRRHFGNAAA